MGNLHMTPGVATITAVMVLARIELIFFIVLSMGLDLTFLGMAEYSHVHGKW